MTRFHFERPDGVQGSAQNILVHLNEFVPPQGYESAGVTPAAIAMAYENPNWFNQLWNKRISVIIQAGKVPSPQTNLPLLIDDIYPNLIGATKEELRFADEFQRIMPFEIDDFNNTTGALIAHVKKPSVSNGDTVYIYFDNPLAVDEQTPFELWSDYESRYGLNNIPSGPNTILDSTRKQNHGTPTGTTLVTAKIGQGLDFDASNFDNVIISNCKFDFDCTISLWFKTTQTTLSDLFAVVDATFDTHGILVEKKEPTNNIRFLHRVPPGLSGGVDLTSTVGGLNDGVFHLLHLVYDGTNNLSLIFIDGIFEGTISNTNNVISGFQNCVLGKLSVTTLLRPYNGILDEFRTFRGVYTADRALTEFNNQNNPSAFFSTGLLETKSSFPPTISMGYEDSDIMGYEGI